MDPTKTTQQTPLDLPAIASTLKEIPFPKKFAVEICSECNLACAMCYQPTMTRLKGVMPFELWQKCADEISVTAPKTECWFSFCGEPLLQADLLIRMLDYGRLIGLNSLNVNTNGMLLTRDIADRLLRSGANLIVVGIDGFSKPVYEAIRINGVREELYENVEYLLKARRALDDGPEIQVQFIVMDSNRHELPEFEKYWLKRGAVVKVRNMLSWGGKFVTPLTVPDEDRIPCPWALTMMHVFWDGGVPRCPGDGNGEEGVGNAWEHKLSELWSRLGHYRQLHLQRRFDELPHRCHDCQDWMTGAAERKRPTA